MISNVVQNYMNVKQFDVIFFLCYAFEKIDFSFMPLLFPIRSKKKIGEQLSELCVFDGKERKLTTQPIDFLYLFSFYRIKEKKGKDCQMNVRAAMQ